MKTKMVRRGQAPGMPRDGKGAMMAAERNTLLRITAENMGRRLGWQEADTAEFAETLRAVGDVVSGDTMN